MSDATDGAWCREALVVAAASGSRGGRNALGNITGGLVVQTACHAV